MSHQSGLVKLFFCFFFPPTLLEVRGPGQSRALLSLSRSCGAGALSRSWAGRGRARLGAGRTAAAAAQLPTVVIGWRSPRLRSLSRSLSLTLSRFLRLAVLDSQHTHPCRLHNNTRAPRLDRLLTTFLSASASSRPPGCHTRRHGRSPLNTADGGAEPGHCMCSPNVGAVVDELTRAFPRFCPSPPAAAAPRPAPWCAARVGSAATGRLTCTPPPFPPILLVTSVLRAVHNAH